MPTVPTAREFVEALRDWGCDPYPAHDDWATWCRPGVWQPIGVIHHHTGGGNTVLTKAISQAAMRRMLIEGRPDLKGPLCQASPHMVPGTARARVALVGWGKANHAGRGSSKTASRVKQGAYRGQAPGEDDTDGNPLYLGLEYLHPGRPDVPYPDALIDAGARAGCAFMEAAGFPREEWPGRQIEHREWTTRKVDRSYANLRADIARVMEEGPDVPLTKDDALLVFSTDDTVKNPTETAPKNPGTSAGTALYRIWADTETLKADVAAVKAAVAKLPTAPTSLTDAQLNAIAAVVAKQIGQQVADAVADKLAARLKD